MKKVTWASIFPFVKDVHPTRDRRIWRTKPEPVAPSIDKIHQIRRKMFFACAVEDKNQNCFKAEIIAPYGADTKARDEEAYYQVLAAVEYYEQHGEWPEGASTPGFSTSGKGSVPQEEGTEDGDETAHHE